MPSPSEHGTIHDQIAAITKNLIAGGIAGAVSRTVVAPLERIKIMLQVRQERTPIADVLKQVWREEGWRGGWRGNGTNIVRIVPYSAVQFTVYEGLKKILTAEQQQSALGRLSCGALAGIASVVCTYPLDMVRTRLSLPGQPSGRQSINRCVVNIYRNEGGLVALYRGISPTLIGIAPYVALNFTVYETLKSLAVRYHCRAQLQRQRASDDRLNADYVLPNTHHVDLSVSERLIYGGIAGAIAQTVTYPLDVIRRRMQVATAPQSMSRVFSQYEGSVDAARKIIAEEGFRGLYRGIVPNYLKVVPAIAVSFVTFEFVRQLLA